MNMPGPELIYVYLDEDGRPSSMTTKREYVPGVRYIRADLAQPAPVPEDVRDWIRSTLAENHYNVRGGTELDAEGKRIQAWLDSQRTDADGSDGE